MPKPKGISDLRSIRSIGTGSVPRGQPNALLQMHRLAEEKHRLEHEMEMWTRKRDQIERRLTEIEQQTQLLRKVGEGSEGSEGSRPTASTPRWREVVIEY